MIDLEVRLENLFRLTPVQKKALARLGLLTAKDLIFYLPFRYEKALPVKSIKDLIEKEEVTLEGLLTAQKTGKSFKKRQPQSEATLKDGTGSIRLLWFGQAYMAKRFSEGSLVSVRGKVSKSSKGLYLANPEIDIIEKSQNSGPLFQEKQPHTLQPIYPTTRFLSSRWFTWRIREIIKQGVLEQIIDPLPEDTRMQYNLPRLKTALLHAHLPEKEKDAEVAKKRLAFDEVFSIQLGRMKERESLKKNHAYTIPIQEDKIREFINRLPFDLSESQETCLGTIVQDLESGHPMSRLLEGDVGSGKTAVAAGAAALVIETAPIENKSARLQVAYMAPTEILARQHFESFIGYFKDTGIQMGLITGSECRKFPSKIEKSGHTHISASQLKKWVANGDISIVVGTHALIQKSVSFKHLALVVIDEQHRFGTKQRQTLAKKSADNKSGLLPHLLSMTATPIPRTLALTIYGDLDLSLLNTLPSGRGEIETKIVGPKDQSPVYDKVKKELENGRQAFVICPRIEEPDPEKELALIAKSAKAEKERLAKIIFPEYKVGLLHGKMKPSDKDEAMRDFADGKIHLLVATSVVEVGINVPNATVMVIEGAERFGLAQLHQLRGRIARSHHKAFCFLFTNTEGAAHTPRLKAIESAKSGFELAELDLSLRGEGSLTGNKQWGLSDLGMEGMKNIKMVEAARSLAMRLVKEDPELSSYPLLKEKAKETSNLHFE